MSYLPPKPAGYLTYKEYAAKHGVSPCCVQGWVLSNQVQYIKVGHKRYIKDDAPPPTGKQHGWYKPKKEALSLADKYKLLYPDEIARIPR